MAVLGAGPKSSSICILVDYPRAAAFSAGTIFTIYEQKIIDSCLTKAGIQPGQVRYEVMGPRRSQTQEEREDFCRRINELPNCKVLIPMEKGVLVFVAGKASIDKYHLSPLVARDYCKTKQVLPTFHPERLSRDVSLRVFVEMAFRRALAFPPKPKEEFLLNPDYETTLATLEQLRFQKRLSVDIETGRGQINTVGFAWTTKDAIAINTLPDRFSPEKFYKIWTAIALLLESDQEKILQNNIYEAQVFAHYGIRLRNATYDTMWQQKFLWPEFKSDLGTVGRVYTERPYWKDDGKTIDSETGQKSWDNVRDWNKHYLYNARDCAGTLEANENQLKDLRLRKKGAVYRSLVAPMIDPLREMCCRGLRVDEARRVELETEATKRLDEINCSLSKALNLRSSKQKLAFLKEKGYQIPKIRVGNKWQESSNELSVKKLRLKYPQDKDLELMLEFAKVSKQLSSYLSFKYDNDGQMRYSLSMMTETGRLRGGKDCWGQGMNPQTIPKKVKQIFLPPPGKVFIEIDLAQAESRFVAYDCADLALIAMLEDPKQDIHSYVAAEIFKCPVEQVIAERKAGDITKRQLGKKSGHGANYDMGATTFQEQCLKDNIVLSKKEAENVLESYHRLFPGIRRGHRSIASEVGQRRYLENPLGRGRYFYGRLDPNTFREAYAYRPQSTIPDITNALILGLCSARRAGEFSFGLHLQVHDSVVLSCDMGNVAEILEYARDSGRWHPRIELAAGRLIIPTDAEVSERLGG